MRKNEQCVKRFLAGVLCAAFVLAGMTACGNTKGAEGSVIAVSKDGTVTDTIREPFDQDYYSQQELQDEVLRPWPLTTPEWEMKPLRYRRSRWMTVLRMWR